MPKRLLFLMLLAALMTLSACVSEPATPEEQAAAAATQVMEEVTEISNIVQLAATAWELEMIGSEGASLPLVEGATPTLNFFVSRYAGFAGCNYYLAAYDIDGDSISMFGPSATRLLCETPEGVMEQEATFIGILQNALAYQVEGDRLTLFTTDEQQLGTLVRAEDLPLEGTTWSLKFYVEEGDPVPVINGSTITATFADGQISGSAGCNNYNGAAAVDDGTIAIEQVASTRMACAEPEGVEEQEAAFLALLEEAATIEVGGSSLILADAEGEPLMLFAGER